jgi:hypothetical protein
MKRVPRNAAHDLTFRAGMGCGPEGRLFNNDRPVQAMRQPGQPVFQGQLAATSPPVLSLGAGPIGSGIRGFINDPLPPRVGSGAVSAPCTKTLAKSVCP